MPIEKTLSHIGISLLDTLVSVTGIHVWIHGVYLLLPLRACCLQIRDERVDITVISSTLSIKKLIIKENISVQL